MEPQSDLPCFYTFSDYEIMKFSNCQWTFALDNSGSTRDDFLIDKTVWDVICDLATSMMKNLIKKPNIIAWNDNAIIK